MIRLIHDHNVLNGLRFSVIEFLLMAVVAIGFACYLATVGAVLFAIALLGVGANSLVVAAVGFGSLRAGEQDHSLRATFSPSSRARILEAHPQAQRATWVLAILTLIPGAIAALVLRDRARRRA